MKEIEVKILEINVTDIQRRLTDLGAQKVFEGEIEWLQYDFPDKRLFQNETFIRLRKKGDQSELTFKKLLNKDQAKVSEETEVVVSDFSAMQRILEALGLNIRRGYPLKKTRISYILDGTHFEIDTLPGIPSYLEIEGASKEKIQEYVQALGFIADDAKPWGTREIFAHYRDKK
jgi:adenylate cyclase, class 2